MENAPISIEMKSFLAKHTLQRILRSFRALHAAFFVTPFIKVFDKPIDPDNSLIPVRNLIDAFITYVNCSNLSPYVTNNIESKLMKLRSRIASTPFELAPFEPLASLILTNASDNEVWKCLLQLLDTLESNLASEEKEVENEKTEVVYRRAGTPQACTEQKSDALKVLLRRELQGSVFLHVQGFWKKYFANKPWQKRCIDLAKEYVKRSAEEDLKFPEKPTEELVFKWMKAVESEIFDRFDKSCDITTTTSSSTSGGNEHFFDKSQFSTSHAHEFDGGQTIRQVDYFIKRRGLPRTDRHHWHDVLVVAEFTESTSTVFMDKFLQLSILMRELFFAQPLRRFAHAFHIFKKSLLLWVYDRSGPYCGSYIDIGKSPQTLVYVMAAYMSMSDEELGLDPNIKYEAHQISVTLDVPGPEKEREFKLSPKSVSQETSFVSRGTSCYHTLDKECAVKFSWRMCGDNSEAELLKIAKDVDGMTDLVGSRDFVKISDLRKDLIFTQKMVKNTLPDDNAMATPLELTDGIMLRVSKSTSTVGSRKRKSGTSDSETVTGRSSKRSRTSYRSSFTRNAGNGGISTASMNPIIEEDETSVPVDWVTNKIETTRAADRESVGEKRKSRDNEEVNGRIKRMHLSSRGEGSSTVDNSGTGTVPGQEEDPSDSLFIAGDGDVEVKTGNLDAYCEVAVKFAEIRDRHSSAVATTPYGRSLHKVKSPLQLVTVLRDAIKAHWSLMTKSKILHRDISANNIIMTGCEARNDWKGYLIDLDLAILLTDGKAQKKRQAMTGTMEFMALEILSGSCETTGAIVEHSYRHDLESFFYVLLWQCLSCGWDDDEMADEEYLSKWYTGTAKAIYEFKKKEIETSTFVKYLVLKFSSKFFCLNNLAIKFRQILFFPYVEFFIGSHEDKNALFSSTIEAFDEAIRNLTM